LRRALLEVEPHILHFSGHGAGDRGLLFVSDEWASAIYRSDSGEVRSRSTNSNEIKFVPAQPLANLLQLCDEHLECVVLNACYSDVQGDAISVNIPFTIGMRDLVEDHVAIKFSQGFYDAIGAGKGYETAFKWGKVAIEFDLADDQAAKILVLRRKGKSIPTIEKHPTNVNTSRTVSPEITSNENNNFFSGLKKLFTPSLSANDYFNRAYSKAEKGDKQGAIPDYNEAIRIKPDYADAYNNRGNAKSDLGDKQGAIADYNEAIRIKPDYANPYYSRGLIKQEIGDKQEALADFVESSRLYQLQKNTVWYENSQARIRELSKFR
jgi:tetratricopeptide (TPR) repeat protein